MELFSTFFNGREEFLGKIKLLDKKHKLNLVKKLQDEQIKFQFLSTITEIQFGLFLDTICQNLFYDKKIENKTPDWTCNIDGQTILCEVARLNPSQPDKRHLDFTDAFMNSIEQIQIGCILGFDYDETKIDLNIIDLNKCKDEVQIWLEKSRIEGDKLLLQDFIEVEFISFNDDLKTACLGGGGTINFDYRRLHSDNSALLVKSQKYNQIIEKYNFPYIICIYLDFHTWLSKRDLYTLLYGGDVEHFEGSVFYSQFIGKSLYYSKDQKLKNVSGVLLSMGNEFTYFNNYSNRLLNPLSLKAFLNIQHPHK